MRKALNLIKKLAKDEEGTALMEYTMLLSLIAVAVIGVAVALGTWVSGTWTALCTALANSGATVVPACPGATP